MQNISSKLRLTRRHALKMAAGSTLLSPLVSRVLANAEGIQLPPRVVFVMQGNGFYPIEPCPETIPYVKCGDREKFESIDFVSHKLPGGFAPLEKHKGRVSVIQGLSGQVTGGGHTTGAGALGQYRLANEGRNGVPPIDATIDFKLGESLPGILPWLGVGMMAKPEEKATTMWSARGANQSLPIILDPELAYNSYFGVVAEGKANRDFHIKRNLLDYMKDETRRVRAQLGNAGAAELDAYIDAYDSLADRQARLLKSRGQLKKHAPAHDGRFTSDVATERLEAQFELAVSALVGGLSNVATITCSAGPGDLNNRPYVGIGDDLTSHNVGHMQTHKREAGGYPHYVRRRAYLMEQVAGLVDRLEAMPEGDGTMMDNTLIIFLSDAPEAHHSKGFEWPLVTIGNLGGRLKLGGQYLSYPGYGKPGHRTVGSFYTTLLHAIGQPMPNFGRLDRNLDEGMQVGPCAELLG